MLERQNKRKELCHRRPCYHGNCTQLCATLRRTTSCTTTQNQLRKIKQNIKSSVNSDSESEAETTGKQAQADCRWHVAPRVSCRSCLICISLPSRLPINCVARTKAK